MRSTPSVADRNPLEAAVAAVAAVKPKLRGWIHAGTFPLALAAGIVRVRARAPNVNAALDASIGLGAPNTFEGRGTVVDYDIHDLGELMGLAVADASALRGTVTGPP